MAGSGLDHSRLCDHHQEAVMGESDLDHSPKLQQMSC